MGTQIKESRADSWPVSRVINGTCPVMSISARSEIRNAEVASELIKRPKLRAFIPFSSKSKLRNRLTISIYTKHSVIIEVMLWMPKNNISVTENMIAKISVAVSVRLRLPRSNFRKYEIRLANRTILR